MTPGEELGRAQRMQDMRLFAEVVQEHPEFESAMEAMFGVLQEGQTYAQLVIEEIERLRAELKELKEKNMRLQAALQSMPRHWEEVAEDYRCRAEVIRTWCSAWVGSRLSGLSGTAPSLRLR